MKQQQEVWLRGPIAGIPMLLQPVAHALLQASEEIEFLLIDFPAADLWHKPAGLASVAFHLQHLRGVLDRLFTYARAQQLNSNQLAKLAAEGNFDETITAQQLVTAFNEQVSGSINELRMVNEAQLLETRCVGRANIPSTMLGLYVHAAEHTMRHLGQLLVTVKVVQPKL